MSRCMSFGRIRVLLDERHLLVDQVVTPIGSRAFDLLVVLIDRRDRVVSKEELLDIAWPGVFVEENNLSVQISTLRRALGPEAIATVIGRGYRFVLTCDADAVPASAKDADAIGRIVRRLAAIARAEVVDWARLLDRDGFAAAAAWRRLRVELIEPQVAAGGGRVIELTAGNLSVEFASVVDAFRWAVDLQQRVASSSIEPPLSLRIAIAVEDLVVDDGRLLGESAHAARGLLELAAAGQVVVTPAARIFADHRLPLRFRPLGEGEPTAFVVEPLPDGAGPGAAPSSSATRVATPAWQSGASVAVLPFAVDGVDAETYYADGMTEEIVTSLASNRTLFVISRTSTLRYRGSRLGPAEIASELRVRYLLQGSLRRAGARLRICVELIDAASNRVIWAERYDGSDEDLFGFQSQIAASMAAAIDPRVQEAEMARVDGRPTESLSAYDSMLRGLSLLYRSAPSDFSAAGQLFRRAIEADPDYAQAHAHLAWWHNLSFGEGISPALSEDSREALRLSLRAVELDPRDATVLWVAGHIQSFMAKRFSVAMGLFEQALAVNPSCAVAWARSATTLAYMGDAEQALERVGHAMRLSPFDPLAFQFFTTNGLASIVAGRYDEAVGWLGKARRLKPNYRAAWRLMVAALALAGERGEAVELGREFMSRSANFRVDAFGAWYPLREPHLATLLEGMRSAGLPD